MQLQRPGEAQLRLGLCPRNLNSCVALPMHVNKPDCHLLKSSHLSYRNATRKNEPLGTEHWKFMEEGNRASRLQATPSKWDTSSCPPFPVPAHSLLTTPPFLHGPWLSHQTTLSTEFILSSPARINTQKYSWNPTKTAAPSKKRKKRNKLDQRSAQSLPGCG